MVGGSVVYEIDAHRYSHVAEYTNNWIFTLINFTVNSYWVLGFKSLIMQESSVVLTYL